MMSKEMALPAGYSSDEFSDDDGFSFSFDTEKKKPLCSRVNGNNVEKSLSKDERLVSAVIDGKIDEVKKIVDEGGVDINCKPQKFNCWTPLMYACSYGYFNIVNYLLENKASVTENCNLLTPLMCLCDARNRNEDDLIKCLVILIEYGADVNATDWFKANALVYAVKRGYANLVQSLISYECNIENADSVGWSPLTHAVKSGNMTLVTIFKEAGANFRRIDRKGRTLHDIATENGNKAMAEAIAISEFDEDVEEIINYDHENNRYSQLELLLSELPDRSRSRFFGYHNEAVRWIQGIGLHSLVPLVLQNNVQLNEVLTMTESEINSLRHMFSYDRIKIKYCIQKFHEHGWSKCSAQFPSEEESLDLCDLLNLVAIILQHLHICSAATYFWKKNRQEPSPMENSYIGQTLKYINLMEKEKDDILRLVEKIHERDQLFPTDLISTLPKKRNNILRVLIFVSLSLVMIKVAVDIKPKFTSALSKYYFKFW